MRTVLITGCGSGFGLLTALTPARRGDRVIATVRAGAERLRQAAAGDSRPLEGHGDPQEVAGAVTAAIDTLGLGR
ncbi:Rossmann-fold NAD(P)-binding domain-containing protein [Nonomuraea cypriaca]|uniref:hypothetical protein n=1 Tax=Nonomuraea cypriaca TaxID=1187855 RepID=UPI001A9C2A36|nr:hypothetical protein [Nonomuraea cypriaca]